MALNAVVPFNSPSIDAAVKQLTADGFPVTDELLARPSPLQYDHINLYGEVRPDVAERLPLGSGEGAAERSEPE
ncbi:hypothetical protein DIZ27_44785 [Streptomyces sp. NWU339]|nr:hypothetical protein DIZ27_44785 [Streptomyces sp. NWU339]